MGAGDTFPTVIPRSSPDCYFGRGWGPTYGRAWWKDFCGVHRCSLHPSPKTCSERLDPGPPLIPMIHFDLSLPPKRGLYYWRTPRTEKSGGHHLSAGSHRCRAWTVSGGKTSPPPPQDFDTSLFLHLKVRPCLSAQVANTMARSVLPTVVASDPDCGFGTGKEISFHEKKTEAQQGPSFRFDCRLIGAKVAQSGSIDILAVAIRASLLSLVLAAWGDTSLLKDVADEANIPLPRWVGTISLDRCRRSGFTQAERPRRPETTHN